MSSRFLLFFGLSFVIINAQAIDLGTAAGFAVLGSSGVTNTGPSVINGDLGVSPGTSITGFPPGIINGAIHNSNAVAQIAQNDATTAYSVAAGIPFSTGNDLTGQDLGGRILTPAIYHYDSSAALTGTLTLDGVGDPNSVFVFQIGSTLITGTGSAVVLINGAQACNVFWQVGSSATLETGTVFRGNVLALASITVNSGAINGGGLYALTGAVTLINNVIENQPLCVNTIPNQTTSTSINASSSTSMTIATLASTFSTTTPLPTTTTTFPASPLDTTPFTTATTASPSTISPPAPPSTSTFTTIAASSSSSSSSSSASTSTIITASSSSSSASTSTTITASSSSSSTPFTTITSITTSTIITFSLSSFPTVTATTAFTTISSITPSSSGISTIMTSSASSSSSTLITTSSFTTISTVISLSSSSFSTPITTILSTTISTIPTPSSPSSSTLITTIPSTTSYLTTASSTATYLTATPSTTTSSSITTSSRTTPSMTTPLQTIPSTTTSVTIIVLTTSPSMTTTSTNIYLTTTSPIITVSTTASSTSNSFTAGTSTITSATTISTTTFGSYSKRSSILSSYSMSRIESFYTTTESTTPCYTTFSEIGLSASKFHDTQTWGEWKWNQESYIASISSTKRYPTKVLLLSSEAPIIEKYTIYTPIPSMTTIIITSPTNKLSKTNWEEIVFHNPSGISENAIMSFEITTISYQQTMTTTIIPSDNLQNPTFSKATIIFDLLSPSPTLEGMIRSSSLSVASNEDVTVTSKSSTRGVSNLSSSTSLLSAQFTGDAAILAPLSILPIIVILGIGFV